MNKENKIKNNKKAIIVAIVMLITLALSSTIAFFTASSTKATENIVSTNKIELKYEDNKDLMKGNLIPVSYVDTKKFFTSSEVCVYTDQNNNKYNACSIYEFSVENISDIAQKLVISLNPTVNTFTNLNYILYKVEEGNNTEIATKGLIKGNLTSLNLLNGNDIKNVLNEETETITLNQGEKVIYKIVFFILAKDYDQSNEDAGKSFGAGVRVDSITTGNYVAENFGESCWTIEPLNDGTNEYRLKSFLGLDELGNVKEECRSYIPSTKAVLRNEQEVLLYSVVIPSKVGSYDTTEIGNQLFPAITFDIEAEGFSSENANDYMIINSFYGNIEDITISDGIKTIQDGLEYVEPTIGAFTGIGRNLETGEVNHELIVNFPKSLTDDNTGSLKKIGAGSFSMSSLSNVIIPASVETIGYESFRNISLSLIEFKGTETGTSLLKELGGGLFYQNESFPSNLISVTIPENVEKIGDQAFEGNINLQSIIFKGNKLTEIGYSAFETCDLTYDEDNPLILPSSITTMKMNVFFNNPNLRAIKYLGTSENVLNNTNSWYTPYDESTGNGIKLIIN